MIRYLCKGPAKAGIHFSGDGAVEKWIPAFAGPLHNSGRGSSGDRFGIPTKQSGFESSANVLLRILSFHDLGRAPELCKGPAFAGNAVFRLATPSLNPLV